MEIVFHRGTSLAPYSNVSTMSFIEGLGGKTNVFWAIYSLRMSFWMVPEMTLGETPCFSATAMYMAQRRAAGALMVIEVVILSSGRPLNSTSMSAREAMDTPHLPTSPLGSGWAG